MRLFAFCQLLGLALVAGGVELLLGVGPALIVLGLALVAVGIVIERERMDP